MFRLLNQKRKRFHFTDKFANVYTADFRSGARLSFTSVTSFRAGFGCKREKMCTRLCKRVPAQQFCNCKTYSNLSYHSAMVYCVCIATSSNFLDYSSSNVSLYSAGRSLFMCTQCAQCTQCRGCQLTTQSPRRT